MVTDADGYNDHIDRPIELAPFSHDPDWIGDLREYYADWVDQPEPEDEDLWEPFEFYSTELLAQVIYNEGFLGIRWDEAEPDTSDERYTRCLLAAGAALGSLWETDTPLQPGEPVCSPASSVQHIFRAVASFAYEKMMEYYTCAGEGISRATTHHMRLRSRAAARRAVASLLGEPAMQEATAEFDRASEAERSTNRPMKKSHQAQWHRDGF